MLYATYQANSRYLTELPTVGVEIEGAILKNQGRKAIAVNIQNFLQTIFPGMNISMAGNASRGVYTISYRFNDHVYKWNVVIDSSIETNYNERGAEFVSAILRNNKDRQLHRQIVGRLAENGFRATPASSGLHVHAGFENPSPGELLLLSYIFARMEPSLVSTFSISHTRGVQYAISIRREIERAIQQIHSGRISIDDLDIEDVINFFRERYRSLNLHALGVHGTVETRLFNSTLNEDALEVMVEFVARLVAAVRSQDPRLKNYLETVNPQEINFEEIAQLLGVPIRNPEIFTTIARELAEDGGRVVTPERFLRGERMHPVLRAAIIGLGAALGLYVLSRFISGESANRSR